MHPQLNAILDEAENRYLKPEELAVLSQYVNSLPERLATYRTLREREIDLMQQVANQLQQEMPHAESEQLERCIKHALLTLRCCSMAMLMNDESLVNGHLTSWLSEMVKVYQTQAIDAAILRLLRQQLNQTLNPQQMAFLNPMLSLAHNIISGDQDENLTAAVLGW